MSESLEVHECDLQECVALLQRGELTEDRLRAAFANGKSNRQKVQSLMWAHSYSTDVCAGLAALSIVIDGQHAEIPANPSQWPYHTVAQAMNDGWRVIKFPDFVADESRNYGLGCEFVLEKYA